MIIRTDNGPVRVAASPASLARGACGWCDQWPCACFAPRTEACACGGKITQHYAREDLTEMMALHNASDLHRAWRETS